MYVCNDCQFVVQQLLLSSDSHIYISTYTQFFQETHWGQQAFYFPSAIPIQRNSKVKIDGTMEMYRSKENARLYNVKFRYTIAAAVDGSNNLMDPVESVYNIP